MPSTPNGTETRKTSRQSIGPRIPPTTSPMNEPADGRHLVQAQGQAALVGGERVGQDGAGVGHQHRAADALQDPHRDQPPGGRGAVHPGHRQQRPRTRANTAKPRLYMRTRPKMSPEPPEAHHQHGRHDQVAHQQPQQQPGVAGLQRVDADPAEDIRQGDQHDRRVDRGHQDAQGRVRQGDPLVTRAGFRRRPGGAVILAGSTGFLPSLPGRDGAPRRDAVTCLMATK